MRRAEELLRQTRYPIDRIAALMGYASPFAFLRGLQARDGEFPSLARERAEQGCMNSHGIGTSALALAIGRESKLGGPAAPP